MHLSLWMSNACRPMEQKISKKDSLLLAALQSAQVLVSFRFMMGHVSWIWLSQMISFLKEILGCCWAGLLLIVWSPWAGAGGWALVGLRSVSPGLSGTDPWLVWSARGVGVVAAFETLTVLPLGKDGGVLAGARDRDPAEEVAEVTALSGCGEEASLWTGEAGEERGWSVTDWGEEALRSLTLGGRPAAGTPVLPTVLANWPEGQLP